MSQEATIMTLRTLFEKQVFIRLTDDQTAFRCISKWPLFSIARRVGVSQSGRELAPQGSEPVSIAQEEVPILRRIRPE